MYAEERLAGIADLATAAGRVTVADLAERYGVTRETVRRDLAQLERHGRLKRVHGGAIAVDHLSVEPALDERERSQPGAKADIARAALEQLPPSGTIALDAGSSVAAFAALIPADRELTVVTHSLPIAASLAQHPGVDLHLLGGHVRRRTLAAVGAWTEDQLRLLSVDVAFVGANGVSARRGLSTPDVAEAQIKTAVVAAAARTVVLADHTKLGHDDFASFAPLTAVHTLVTDTRETRTEDEAAALAALAELDVDVVLA